MWTPSTHYSIWWPHLGLAANGARRVASLECSQGKNFIFEKSSILEDVYDTNCFAICWCVSVNFNPEVVVNPVVNPFTGEFDLSLSPRNNCKLWNYIPSSWCLCWKMNPLINVFLWSFCSGKWCHFVLLCSEEMKKPNNFINVIDWKTLGGLSALLKL